jgi:predicted transcriptional regulator
MLEMVQRGILKAIDIPVLGRLVEARHDPADVRPETVAELAATVGRAGPIIRRSLARLEAAGLVRLAPAPAAGRKGGAA